MAYTGGGLAESNLKFDNALLRTVLYSPGSRELCRESGRATHALRIILCITCKAALQVIFCVVHRVYISRTFW